MKRNLILLFSVLMISAVVASISCRRADSGASDGNKSRQNSSGDIEKKLDNLEKRIAALESGGGGRRRAPNNNDGEYSGTEGGDQTQAGSEYTQLNVAELNSDPAKLEGQKVRFMAKIVRIDAAKTIFSLSRGQGEVKVNYSGVDEAVKTELSQLKLNEDERPPRATAMGVIKNGVLVADKIKVVKRGMGGPGMGGGRGGRRGGGGGGGGGPAGDGPGGGQ